MRNLAEVCALSLTVLGQAMPDKPSTKADEWHDLLVNLLKVAKTMPSIARNMELNPDCGYWFFKRPYIDKAFFSDVLDEYRDAVFWEELVTRMAMFSLVESVGQTAVDNMSREERAERTAALEKAFWNEVTTRGVERLMFLLPGEEG